LNAPYIIANYQILLIIAGLDEFFDKVMKLKHEVIKLKL